MSVPPCMTDSNQTKNNFNVGTYRRISRPSKGPYYKKFRAQPSPEIFLAHLLKNTWKCLVWKYERWGVLGQGLFWRFCKKNSKKFHKNWSSLGSYWSISKFFLRGWTADQVGHFGPTNGKIGDRRIALCTCTLYLQKVSLCKERLCRTEFVHCAWFSSSNSSGHSFLM